MLGPTLLFGLLMGARHALEVDHVAAVAALATRSKSLGGTLRLASFWGGGHAAVLIVVGAIMLALGAGLPARVVALFELGIGAVLIALGVDVLRRLRQSRVHFHVHQHDDGRRHLHAHAHAGGEIVHDPAHHEHQHVTRLAPRAVLVGAMHGLAGSAALVLVSLEAVGTPLRALAFLAVYSAGATAGMMLFSAVLFLPFHFSAAPLARASRLIEGALGAFSVGVGCWMMAQVGLP